MKNNLTKQLSSNMMKETVKICHKQSVTRERSENNFMHFVEPIAYQIWGIEI